MMSIDFLEPAHASPVEPLEPTGWFVDGQAQLSALRQSPDDVCWLHACQWSHHKLGGVFVQPANIVLGLRGWPDAMEWTISRKSLGATPLPVSCFALEKITRMMLRQSALALHILAAPNLFNTPHHVGVDARHLIEMTLTRSIKAHYIDLLNHIEVAHLANDRQADLLDLTRQCITGCTLYVHGAFGLQMHSVSAFWLNGPVRDMLDALLASQPVEASLMRQASKTMRRLFDTAKTRLPERPTDYNGAQSMLVNARLLAMDPKK